VRYGIGNQPPGIVPTVSNCRSFLHQRKGGIGRLARHADLRSHAGATLQEAVEVRDPIGAERLAWSQEKDSAANKFPLVENNCPPDSTCLHKIRVLFEGNKPLYKQSSSIQF
jgi:hypothetical protein